MRGAVRAIALALSLVIGAAAQAQVETPEQAIARDAATWGALAGLAPDAARAELDAQIATLPVTAALTDEFGARLAGIAVSHRPFRIEVLLTGDAPVADRTVVAGGQTVGIAFRTGALATRAQLIAALTLHQAAIRGALSRPPGLGVDARTGALTVFVADGDLARQPVAELEQRFADLTGVPVRVRALAGAADGAAQVDATAAPATEPVIEGGGRLIGTDPVSGGRYLCTTGFVVTDGTREGVLTAAHCLDALRYVGAGGRETPLDFGGQWGWSFQDVQLGTAVAAFVPDFFADTARTVRRPVTAVRPRAASRAGDVVCHRGERSGYSCAEIAFVDFAPPGDLCGGPCAPSWVAVDGPGCRGGDSGGPVFEGTVALGILKGGSYRPGGACALYYYMAVDYLPAGWRVATAVPVP